MSPTTSEDLDGAPLRSRIRGKTCKHTPIKRDENFEDYTKCEPDPEALSSGQVLHLPSSFHDRAKNRKTYASFGENGTTASVNSSGRIIQISRYLGYGRSGFFCADQANLSEPYLVQHRMDELMDRSRDNMNGLQLNLQNLVDVGGLQPSLEFVFDRWPRFAFHRKTAEESIKISQQPNLSQGGSAAALSEKPLNDPELSIQYFCHQGTVFQRYIFRLNKSGIPLKDLNKLRIDAEICVRNLDFERSDSSFNLSNQQHDFRLGPRSRSLIIMHEITPEMANQMGIQKSHGTKQLEAAALIITPFANGRAQRVTERGYIVLNRTVRKRFMKARNIDITLAYRLQLLEKQSKWENLLIPAQHLKRMQLTFSSTEPFRRIRFSNHEQFNFLVTRNLEHILSVCCIPIPKSPILGSPEGIASGDESNAAESKHSSVAITCGDISGHFIGQRTCLSTFQFLCKILRFLREKSRGYSKNIQHCKCAESSKLCDTCERRKDGTYCERLSKRIREMLDGHVKWICTAKPLKDDNTFSPHYWATGEWIEKWDGLPNPSLVDTPLHLLKIFWLHHSQLDEEEQDREKNSILSHIPTLSYDDYAILQGKVLSWILRLQQSNIRGNYAFFEQFNQNWADLHVAKSPEYEDAKFRLVDHVMICLAVKCVTEFRLESVVDETLKEVFPYEQSRLKVLKRFTLEGPLLKQRMLATCRTATESRFLFHSKDTFLFHAMEMGFFQEKHAKRPEEKRNRFWRNIDGRWRSTMDAQAYYDEYQHLEWEKPLRFVLAFVLGCQRRKIYKSPIEDPLMAMSNTLFNQASPSGLFPGRLNEDQEPIPFNDDVNRDNYWHTTFETLNSLWSHGRNFFDTHSSREEGRMSTKSVSHDSPDPSQALGAVRGQISTKTVPFSSLGSLLDLKSLVEFPDDWLQISSEASDLFFTPKIDEHEFQRAEEATKLTVPDIIHGFSRTKRIWNETSESQRLHVPDAIDTVISGAAKTLRWQQTLQFSDPEGLKGTVIDVPRKSFPEAKLKHLIALIGRLDAMWKENRSKQLETNSARPKTKLEHLRGLKNYLKPPEKNANERPELLIVLKEDLNAVREHLDASFQEQERLEQLPANNGLIFKHLREERTMRLAKKRIVWLPTGDKETALLCYLASSSSKKDSMLRFFERHATHDKYFFDGASLTLNKWETEMHLSFFRRVTPEKGKRKAFLEVRKARISNVSFVEIEASERDPRGEAVFLLQETISFRFLGDFFDRFWTCHFLDNQRDEECRMTSADRSKEDQEKPPKSFSDRLHTLLPQTSGNHDTDHWKQRKVLELLLFGEILEEVYVSTEDILEWVKQRVFQSPKLEHKKSSDVPGINVASLSSSRPTVDGSLPLNSVAEAVHGVQLLRKANSENYSTISDNWRLYEQILQEIEDDLSGNIEIITQWNRREEERGSEKPRWTLRDERRYRATIIRITVSNQRKIREIERLKAKIKAFRESLPGRLESVRDDISFRGSENINLFTYVTVVFLPLGFATSIFSMSGAPGRVTLVSMVELAFIALAITVFALANAKTTGQVPVRLVIWAFRCINNLLLLLVVWIWNQAIFLYWLYSRVPSSNIHQADDKGVSEEAHHTKRINKAVALVLRSDLSSSLESALEENPREKARRHGTLDGKRKPGNSRDEADDAGTDVKHADSTGWCFSWLRKLYSGGNTKDEEIAQGTELETLH